MDFFEKIKRRMLLNKLPFILAAGINVVAGVTLVFSGFLKKNSDATPIAFVFILISVGSLAMLIRTLRDNNDYKEILRQAKLLGDIETVGNMLENTPKAKEAKDLVIFNERVLFYSGYQSTKIIIPSKITKIFTDTGTYKGVRQYYVRVFYQYEQSILINAYTQNDAESLCEQLRQTFAQHLIDEK